MGRCALPRIIDVRLEPESRRVRIAHSLSRIVDDKSVSNKLLAEHSESYSLVTYFEVRVVQGQLE